MKLNVKEWDALEWFYVMFLLGVGILIGVSVHQARVEYKADKEPLVIYDKGTATVLKNENCHGSKYSYNCDITMSDGMRLRTDLSDWPSGMLYPQTVLKSQVRTNGTRQKYVYCNAQYCHTYMTCYKSECFNKTYAKGNENVP